MSHDAESDTQAPVPIVHEVSNFVTVVTRLANGHPIHGLDLGCFMPEAVAWAMRVRRPWGLASGYATKDG